MSKVLHHHSARFVVFLLLAAMTASILVSAPAFAAPDKPYVTGSLTLVRDGSGHGTKDASKINSKNGSVSAEEQGTLRISALNTGAEGSRDYWIKETKAPNGYTLPSGDAAIHKVTVTPGVKTVAEITVDNTANSNITLPVTGAAGTAGLLALAGALAASGAVVVIRNKKKASVEE